METSPHNDWWHQRRQAVRDEFTHIHGPGLEDAIQEAMRQLHWERLRGTRILNATAWCVTCVKRRLTDEMRKAKRLVPGLDLEAVAAAESRESMEEAVATWQRRMWEAGAALTPKAAELLERILRGTRTNKGLARELGVTVKSLKEARARLQATLRRFLEDMNGVPPP